MLWNANVGFEVREGQYRHTINLTNGVCSCITWQLRGVPCQHVISTLCHIEQELNHLWSIGGYLLKGLLSFYSSNSKHEDVS